MNNYGGTRIWLFYAFLGALADALDTILTFVVPEKAPKRIHTSSATRQFLR
ncbi:hypothetical protein EDD16DRAFT_1834119 [Pisolithus croceorrhizus]|nr:hypothetical protein EDD16DRAFT_1834119 [Pisolithus croceorrhizus]